MTTSAARIGPAPEELRAVGPPIEYAEIRRAYQSVRLVVAAGVLALSLVAATWDVSGWAYLALAALAVVAHAATRLGRAGRSPLGSLLLDVTLMGVLAAAVGAPRAEIAAFAYLMAAALLMLSARQAAVVAAYAALWAAVVVAVAPFTGLADAGAAEGVAIDPLLGVLMLALLAGLLATASRLLHRARRRHERALAAERAANRLKDEFVSMISHEFRTPLTSIAGFVETLQDAWPTLPDQDREEFLTIIHGQARQLSHLVEDVLVIPRLEAGRLPFDPQEVELRPLVQQVVGVLLNGDGTEAEVTVPGGVTVHADPQRVTQVLRNLVENAVKYGGDQILIDGEFHRGRYLVSVADNGPGVAPSSVDRIFEMFEQATKGDARTDRGMGLGLPIARRLVQAMGGDLWHEARFPTGSIFRFSLPLASAPAPAPALGAASS